MMIEEILDYNFENKSLLKQALTHRSKHTKNYERLEFVGDTVLSLCVSQYLYAHTNYKEGPLSVIRSDLVSKTNLNEVGLKIQIDQYIITAKKQVISESIRADVIEALIGAVFLDSNLETCYQLIQQHIIDTSSLKPIKDSKTMLQEWTHQKKTALPKYNLVNTSGPAHDLKYETECLLESGQSARATAKTKQSSEQKAAKILYQQLTEEIA